MEGKGGGGGEPSSPSSLTSSASALSAEERKRRVEEIRKKMGFNSSSTNTSSNSSSGGSGGVSSGGSDSNGEGSEEQKEKERLERKRKVEELRRRREERERQQAATKRETASSSSPSKTTGSFLIAKERLKLDLGPALRRRDTNDEEEEEEGEASSWSQIWRFQRDDLLLTGRYSFDPDLILEQEQPPAELEDQERGGCQWGRGSPHQRRLYRRSVPMLLLAAPRLREKQRLRRETRPKRRSTGAIDDRPAALRQLLSQRLDRVPGRILSVRARSEINLQQLQDVGDIANGSSNNDSTHKHEVPAKSHSYQVLSLSPADREEGMPLPIHSVEMMLEALFSQRKNYDTSYPLTLLERKLQKLKEHYMQGPTKRKNSKEDRSPNNAEWFSRHWSDFCCNHNSNTNHQTSSSLLKEKLYPSAGPITGKKPTKLNLLGNSLETLNVKDGDSNAKKKKKKTKRKDSQGGNWEVMVLSANKLNEFPVELCMALRNLKQLHLCYNKLSTLPQQISLLSKLEVLSLRGNHLSTVPVALFQLTHLLELDLAMNKLTALYSPIKALTSLRRLFLCYNQLSYLPYEIGHLHALRELDISHNALQNLPATIGLLPNLQQLNTQHNHPSLNASLGPIFFPAPIFVSLSMPPDSPHTSVTVAEPPPPPLPPAVVDKGLQAVALVTHYRKILNQSQPFGRVKLLILGDKGAGKTTLLSSLQKALPKKKKKDKASSADKEEPSVASPVPSHRSVIVPRGEHSGSNSGLKKSGKMRATKVLSTRFIKRDRVQKEDKEEREMKTKEDKEKTKEEKKSSPKVKRKKGKKNKHQIQSGSHQGIHIVEDLLLPINEETTSSSSQSAAAGLFGERRTGAATSFTEISYQAWDFDGAFDLRDIHQLFIAEERAVILLVWDMSAAHAEEGLEWWLQCIESRCSPSGSPPSVVIVATHMDHKRAVDFLISVGQTPREGFFQLALRHHIVHKYLSNYPFIRWATAVNCLKLDGITELQSKLNAVALELGPLSKPVPQRYHVLAEMLAALSMERFQEQRSKSYNGIPQSVRLPALSWPEFQEAAALLGLSKTNDANNKDKVPLTQVADFLHSTGSVFYFPSTTTDPSSSSSYEPEPSSLSVFLDVDWLVGVMYSVFEAHRNRRSVLSLLRKRKSSAPVSATRRSSTTEEKISDNKKHKSDEKDAPNQNNKKDDSGDENGKKQKKKKKEKGSQRSKHSSPSFTLPDDGKSEGVFYHRNLKHVWSSLEEEELFKDVLHDHPLREHSPWLFASDADLDKFVVGYHEAAFPLLFSILERLELTYTDRTNSFALNYAPLSDDSSSTPVEKSVMPSMFPFHPRVINGKNVATRKNTLSSSSSHKWTRYLKEKIHPSSVVEPERRTYERDILYNDDRDEEMDEKNNSKTQKEKKETQKEIQKQKEIDSFGMKKMGDVKFERWWLFSFLPPGIFARLLVRLLRNLCNPTSEAQHLIAMQVECYWRQGLILSNKLDDGNTCAIVQLVTCSSAIETQIKRRMRTKALAARSMRSLRAGREDGKEEEEEETNNSSSEQQEMSRSVEVLRSKQQHHVLKVSVWERDNLVAVPSLPAQILIHRLLDVINFSLSSLTSAVEEVYSSIPSEQFDGKMYLHPRFNFSKLLISTEVPCLHCLSASNHFFSKSEEEVPELFAFDTCQNLVSKPQSKQVRVVPCGGIYPVRMDRLVPDLVLMAAISPPSLLMDVAQWKAILARREDSRALRIWRGKASNDSPPAVIPMTLIWELVRTVWLFNTRLHTNVLRSVGMYCCNRDEEAKAKNGGSDSTNTIPLLQIPIVGIMLERPVGSCSLYHHIHVKQRTQRMIEAVEEEQEEKTTEEEADEDLSEKCLASQNVNIALHLCQAMHFLHSLHPPALLQSDLCSRNIMVPDYTVDSSQPLIPKIGDIGASWLVNAMSRNLVEQKESSRESTPRGGLKGWKNRHTSHPDSSDSSSPRDEKKNNVDDTTLSREPFPVEASPKTDIYNFGVILCELLTGEEPEVSVPKFRRGSITSMLNPSRLLSSSPSSSSTTSSPNDSNTCSWRERWENLVQICLHEDPAFRPTFKQILEELIRIQELLLGESAVDAFKEEVDKNMTSFPLEGTSTSSLMAGSVRKDRKASIAEEENMDYGSKPGSRRSSFRTAQKVPWRDINALKEFRFVKSIPQQMEGSLDCMALVWADIGVSSTGGNKVQTGSVWCGNEDGDLLIYSLEEENLAYSKKAHADRILDILFIPQSGTVWTSSLDKTIKIWKAKSGNMLRILGGIEDEISAMLLVDNDVWCGSLSGKVYVWDTQTFACKMVSEVGKDKAVIAIAHDPVRNYVWTSASCDIIRWNASTFQQVDRIPDAHQRSITSMIFVSRSDEGAPKQGEDAAADEMWTGGLDCTIKVWSSSDAGLITTLAKHTRKVYCLAQFDSNYVLSGSWDKSIISWNVHSKEAKQVLKGKHEDAVTLLKVFPCKDGKRRVWSSSWDKTVCVWE
ncbi:LRR receptor-like serine/threonine-protein kinase ERECTA [Balamuthia mandrillaris]